MVTQSDYDQRALDACKAVLLELVHLMGEFKDQIVVVGGWVPSFLIPQTKDPHIGSMDIDVALDFAHISDESYHTILGVLSRRGYQQDQEQPFRFFRNVPTPDGRKVRVEVDFLAGEYGGTTKGHRTQIVQDVRARKARGCDLAFDDTITVSIEGELPDGGRDCATFKVAGIVPFLVMKGMVIDARFKEKDAYDVYYCVRNFPGSTSELTKRFRPWLENSLVQEGLQKIRAKFSSVAHVGPKWVVDFLEIVDEEEQEIMQRRVFETVNEWLEALGFQS